jgi:hypothetical protein
VRVDERKRVVAIERPAPGEQLVQRDPQGIQVAALVDRAIEATGLFGRQVVQRALHRRARDPRTHARTRRNIEVDQLHRAGRRVVHQVARIDVLVNDEGGMDVREAARDRGGDIERLADREPALGEPARELGAKVLDDQRRAAAIAEDLERLDHRGSTHRAQHIELVLGPVELLGGDELAARLLDDHGPGIGDPDCSVHDRAGSRVEPLHRAIAGELVSHLRKNRLHRRFMESSRGSRSRPSLTWVQRATSRHA